MKNQIKNQNSSININQTTKTERVTTMKTKTMKWSFKKAVAMMVAITLIMSIAISGMSFAYGADICEDCTDETICEACAAELLPEGPCFGCNEPLDYCICENDSDFFCEECNEYDCICESDSELPCVDCNEHECICEDEENELIIKVEEIEDSVQEFEIENEDAPRIGPRIGSSNAATISIGSNKGTLSIINLILCMLGAVMILPLMFSKKQKNGKRLNGKCFQPTIIAAVAGVIVLLITQDFNGQMILTDKYTIINATLFTIQATSAFLALHEPETETD